MAQDEQRRHVRAQWSHSAVFSDTLFTERDDGRHFYDRLHHERDGGVYLGFWL